MISFSSIARISLALVLGSLAVACTHSTKEAADHGTSSVVDPDEPGKDPGAGTDAGPAPVGPRVASVTALGTGCPNDSTWEATIAPDGQSVALKLHAHDVSVVRNVSFEIKDCTVTIKVANAAGYEFTLAGFDAVGYGSLQGEGMRGEESLRYYLQGNPTVNQTRVQEFTNGPGASYSINETFSDDTTVWSPCGGGRDMIVQDRKVLRNNTDKTGYGFIGSETMSLKLRSRPCAL